MRVELDMIERALNCRFPHDNLAFLPTKSRFSSCVTYLHENVSGSFLSFLGRIGGLYLSILS